MKTDFCQICKKEFYKYRKVLKFCSRQCSAKSRKFKETEEYLDKIKNKINNSIRICPQTGCWNFLIHRDELGRGRIWFRNRTVIASRVSYTIFKGDIPPKIYVCHKCDNYSCVNPDHLFLGTSKENAEDRRRKGREARGEMMPNSKLKSRFIVEIFELKKSGLSQQKIGEKYGVSQSAIGRILTGKTWKHICQQM